MHWPKIYKFKDYYYWFNSTCSLSSKMNINKSKLIKFIFFPHWNNSMHVTNKRWDEVWKCELKNVMIWGKFKVHHEADINSMNSCQLIVSTAYKCQTNLDTWIHPSSLPAAMDGHQRGKKLMLKAPPHVPQKDDIPWLQRGSLHSCNFLVIIWRPMKESLQFPRQIRCKSSLLKVP